MRGVAAGVALPVVVAVLLVLLTRPGGDTAPEDQAASLGTPAGPITPPQSASIDFVRSVARRDLTRAGARLAACAGPRVACAHVPLAHIGFGGQAAAGMLANLGTGLPIGDCRGLVLGSGNTLAMLSSDADEMRRALGNRTDSGRRTSSLRYESIRELIDYARGMLRGPEWTACTPAPAQAS